MHTYELDGKTYRKPGARWVDDRGLSVSEILQDKLNKVFFETIDLSLLKVWDIVQLGDEFKQSASIGLAIKCYDHAMQTADWSEISYILPRLTSCYRKQGQPQKVIDTLAFAKKKFGANIVSPPLLTSAAAAYCDLNDFESAKKCCKIAYAKLNGNAPEELKLVYKRIEKHFK